MDKKLLFAALAAGVFSFLLGWVLWGMLDLMGYYQDNMNAAWNALWKKEENMNMIGMIISNLAYGALVAWVVWRGGGATLMSGLMAGAILGGLMSVSMDMFYYSMVNMYSNKMIVCVDVLVNAATTGLTGAVAGQVLGMGAKSNA